MEKTKATRFREKMWGLINAAQGEVSNAHGIVTITFNDGSKIDFTEPVVKLDGMAAKERAKLRPPDFEQLNAAQQWEIDKDLGILDWDGT